MQVAHDLSQIVGCLERQSPIESGKSLGPASGIECGDERESNVDTGHQEAHEGHCAVEQQTSWPGNRDMLRVP